MESGRDDNIVYPMQTSTNYIGWTLAMQINLLTQGLWEAMNGEGQVTEHDDTSTLSTFL